jgi:hypothetical protein
MTASSDGESPAAQAVAAVSRGQLRAVMALVGGAEARTYHEAAAVMGVHVGTLYRHLGARPKTPGRAGGAVV